MRLTLTIVASLFGIALATPVPAGHEWQAPGAGDVRSPCPGLNSLANHGFLNRNGMNITVPQLISGGADGINIGPDFMSTVGIIALASPETPNGMSFNLDDLQKHNFPIEHDASLSRQDYYFNHDDLDFNKASYHMFIKHFNGLKVTNNAIMSKARYSRVEYSVKNNPTFAYGPKPFLFSYGETGLYTQIMGMSPLATGARVDYIRSLFEQQRLPYELGWSKSALPITFNSLGKQIVQLFLASGEVAPEGMHLTKYTYGDTLSEFSQAIATLLNITNAG